MKIFTLHIPLLLLSVAYSFAAKRELQNGQCPNMFSINPENGQPVFTCEPTLECDCTVEPYTMKEDVAPGDPTCYRCSKPDGAACVEDFECNGLASASCNDGFCGNGNAQCPNTATVSNTGIITSMCTTNAECECTLDDFTLREDVSRDNQPACYHCSKPDGSACQENHECIATFPTSFCNDGICGTEICRSDGEDFIDDDGIPGTSSECTLNDECVCTDGDFTIREEVATGCFHCSKPDGSTCVENNECLLGSQCIDGICDGQPNCPSIDASTIDFTVDQEFDCTRIGNATIVPCECSDMNYPFPFIYAIGETGLLCYLCTDEPGRSSACQANQACDDLGLLGNCCPTGPMGEFEECCDDGPVEECEDLFEPCEDNDDCCFPWICSIKTIDGAGICSAPSVRQRPSLGGDDRGGAAGKAKGGGP